MRKAAALRRLPVCLDRVDLVIAVVDALVVMHFVEDEVLEFRTEIGSVADARAGEIGLRFPGDIARIPARAAKARRSLLAQPRLLKSASSRFLPVHKADLERQQRAETGPSWLASGRTGVRAIAVIPFRARNTLHRRSGLRRTLDQRLRLGDLGHFRRRCKAFEGGREDGVGVGGAGG